MKLPGTIAFGVLILAAGTAIAILSSDEAPLRFTIVGPDLVEQRLKAYDGNDLHREATLKGFFETAGCSGDHLSEQPVKGLKEPNLICQLPGDNDSVIAIGAHYDHVTRGHGVVDNWSGASMLPGLYEAVKTQPRHHTFIFLAFSGEEQGLIGSDFYVRHLTDDQAKKIVAMVNLDTLGLGPAEVWVSRSDKALSSLLNGLAHAMKIPLRGVNVEYVGESDEESFIARKIPTVTVHSLTQETLHVLHSPRDRYEAIRFNDYYSTYKLLSGYLVLLDTRAELRATTPAQGGHAAQ